MQSCVLIVLFFLAVIACKKETVENLKCEKERQKVLPIIESNDFLNISKVTTNKKIWSYSGTTQSKETMYQLQTIENTVSKVNQTRPIH